MVDEHFNRRFGPFKGTNCREGKKKEPHWPLNKSSQFLRKKCKEHKTAQQAGPEMESEPQKDKLKQLVSLCQAVKGHILCGVKSGGRTIHAAGALIDEASSNHNHNLNYNR